MKTTGIILSLLVTSLTVALLTKPAADSGDGREEKEESLLPVETLILTQTNSTERRRYFTGTVNAARKSQLSFERAARLTKVLVDEGDSVRANQPLARIDQRQLQNRLDELKAQEAQQQAVLVELQKGPRAETIASTRAQLAAVAADVELAKATLNRMQRLFDRKATSAQSLDESRLASEAASAKHRAIAKQLKEQLAGTRIEQVDAQKAVVAALNAQIEQIKLDQDDSELMAPFAGVVTQRWADEGDFLTSQQPLLEISEMNQLEARIGVSTNLIQKLKDADYLVLTSNGSEFTGTLSSIVPQVDPSTRTQLAIVKIDDPRAAELADGQLIKLSMTETIDTDGFKLPITALAKASQGLWSVYVVEGNAAGGQRGIVRSRAVEVLYTDADSAIVSGTISAGERLVSVGIHRIAPGQEVRWKDATTQFAERQ